MEVEKGLFKNQFVEENIKHTKKDQDDPEKNKTKENSNQINTFDKEVYFLIFHPLSIPVLNIKLSLYIFTIGNAFIFSYVGDFTIIAVSKPNMTIKLALKYNIHRVGDEVNIVLLG